MTSITLCVTDKSCRLAGRICGSRQCKDYFFSLLIGSFAPGDRGAVVSMLFAPAPVVPGLAFIVPRSGVPLVLPVSLPVPGSVGVCTDGLTLGPD